MKRNGGKRILSLLMAALIAVGMFPSLLPAFAVKPDDIYGQSSIFSVERMGTIGGSTPTIGESEMPILTRAGTAQKATTASALQTMINGANKALTIDVSEMDSFEQVVTITNISGATITLTGADGTVLTADSTRHFEISRNAKITLVFDNVILDGDNTGGGIYVNWGSLTLKDAVIQNCNGGSYGGGIHISFGAAALDNVLIQGCSAYNGGGIHSDYGDVTIKDSDISGNTAIYHGGGIGNVNASTNGSFELKIENTTINDNTANGNGGGIVNSGDLTMKNSTVNDNASGTRGGGVHHGSGTFVMYNNEINRNTASDGGGGIYHAHGAMEMYSGEIIGNAAYGSVDSTYGGGGVGQAGGGTFTMYGGKISGNSAELGGGVYHSGKFVLDGGEISENEAATTGGGIYSYINDLVIKSGDINDNISAGIGGGIYSRNNNLVLEGGKIYNNNAEESGGGIYYRGSYESLFEMAGGEIYSNNAEESGGGIYYYGATKGFFEMADGEIRDNTAGVNGGGIYFQNLQEECLVKDSLITGNHAAEDGGGIYVSSYDKLTLSNIQFDKNTAGNGLNYFAPEDTALYEAHVSNIVSLSAPADLLSSDQRINKAFNNLDVNYIRTYTVTFNTVGGQPIPENQKPGYSSKVEEPTDPTKKGYKFLGWKYQDELWDFDEDVVTSNMTLVAQWELAPIVEYTVKFDTDGGTPVPQDQTVEAGEKVQEPGTEPTKDDYIFKGWYYGAAQWDFAKDTVAGDMTLVAIWEPKKVDPPPVTEYTVKFDTDGGAPVPENQTVEKGKKATRPADPVKNGYTFTGWHLNGVKWDFEKNTVAGDMTLVAIWKENVTEPPVITEYTVKFDANGGAPTPADQKVEKGEKVQLPANPSRNGYTFAGWHYGDVAWNFEEDTVRGNMTLVAVWKEVDSGGGKDPGTDKPDELDKGEGGNTDGSSGGGRDSDRSVQVGRDVYINDLDIPLANDLLTILEEEIPLAEISLFDIPDTGVKGSVAGLVVVGAFALAALAYKKD